MVKGKVIVEDEEDFESQTANLKDIMERMKKLENKEPVEESIEEPVADEETKMGELVNYPEKVDYGVVDEEGTRIPCKSLAEAKILSLLLELKGGK